MFKAPYREIKEKAVLLDRFIEVNKGFINLPIKEVDVIMRYLFPSCFVKSKGMYKTVFRICTKGPSKKTFLVLKIGKRESIEDDHRAYKRLPKKIRRKYFAKVFWHTKYCLLQEYGEETYVTKQDLDMLKAIASRYGLVDIKKKNVRNVNGKLKIIDATVFTTGGSERIKFMRDYVRIKFS
jgi:hypothetical protein